MSVYYSAQNKSNGPATRSTPPSTKFNRLYSAHSRPSSSSFASASTSAFTAARSFQRPTSPTRLNLCNYNTPSLSFSSDRPGSPNRPISFSRRTEKSPAATAPRKRTCMCAPTNHPGSFRCSLHKGGFSNNRVSKTASCGGSTRLNMRRSAMKNSLVRIGTVEGDLVKRALAALIRPSSHNQRRRGEFRPRPSRLSSMSKA
ncbi:hypothetical protein ACS0TY_024207 [Phlomoides rotata]